MTEGPGEHNVQSVQRALEVLEALSAAGGESGVAELALTLGLPGPTVHRILQTLNRRGYVLRLPSRRYALGPALMRLGDAATRRLSAWAMPALLRLADSTRETANLAVLDGDMATYVAQSPSPHSMRMFTEVGQRVFPHSTGVGKVLLAQRTDPEVLEIVRRTGMPGFTESTLVTEEDLLSELATIRRRGYAIDEGEQEEGVRCFALLAPGLVVPAAVSVSGPAARVTRASADRIVEHLREAAAALRAAARA
ncbi:IclR family transcriptional regulator [Microbacterium sp. RD1]|uniref:IclR family transcriptional regulator n=1 Tax=Microbacterium sp. RD1 TaxID=3457313 RepID=UPI003FA5BAD0